MVRLKHRWLCVEILNPLLTLPNPSTISSSCLAYRSPVDDNLTLTILQRTIRQSLAELFGDFGSAFAGSFTIPYYSPASSTLILRCLRPHYRLLWFALTFLSTFPLDPPLSVVLRVFHVSATMKHAQLAIVRHSSYLVKSLSTCPPPAKSLPDPGSLKRPLPYTFTPPPSKRQRTTPNP